jgi:glycosyltransferase involved in cell wall biosynthesis
MSAKYSVCITHYNDKPTIERSLESVLAQVDDTFEVIVVDNFSTDGSETVLKKYAEDGRIRLVQAKCSRGRGRQIAFENSTGPYIIANFDMDDIMLPRLRELLSLFHASHEDRLVRVKRSLVGGTNHYCNVTIARREAIVKLGGWRDLNWYEDADLWYRGKLAGLLDEIDFPIMQRNRSHPERAGYGRRMRHRYLTYRECIRAGLWDAGLDLKVRGRTLPIYLAAWVSAKLNPLATAVDGTIPGA